MSDLELAGEQGGELHGPSVGLVIGTVSNVNDPEQRGRVKVVFPTISSTVESNWARVLTPGAGARHGVHWPFMIGDEVVVGFLDGHPELPVVVGALFSRSHPEPVPTGKIAAHRVLRSASGHVLRLDDTLGAEKVELITARPENALTLSASEGAVTITAATRVEIRVGADIVLTMQNGEVSLTCRRLAVTCAAEASLTSTTVDVDARATISMTGAAGINLNNGSLEVRL